ncbi:MAG: sortase [Chloroflexota bacterium]
MTAKHRSSPAPENQESAELLEMLFDSQPNSSSLQRTPVALRSEKAQRDYALRGFLRRTWVDGVLKHSERLFVLAALIVFSIWFVDGPVRDWWYEYNHSTELTTHVTAPSEGTHTTVGDLVEEGVRAAPLPYVTSDMLAAEPVEDFIAPREAVPREALAIEQQPSKLVVPTIGLDTSIEEVFIVNGVWEVAEYAAGYLNGTALPEEEGNTVLAGHAGMRGAVFRDLGQLRVDDDIYLDAGGWRYHYRVSHSTTVWPTQVEVLDPSDSPVLTMITCTNWDTQRLVVVADLVGSQPSPKT